MEFQIHWHNHLIQWFSFPNLKPPGHRTAVLALVLRSKQCTHIIQTSFIQVCWNYQSSIAMAPGAPTDKSKYKHKRVLTLKQKTDT